MRSTEAFTTALQEALFSHTSLDHPLLVRLSAGDPTGPKILRTLGLQGYQLTKVFSRYVAGLAAQCRDPALRVKLATNLYEEETGKLSGTENHYVLMHRFLDGLGISEKERETALALPTTIDLIEYRWKLVNNPDEFHKGVASILIASEGQNLERRNGKSRYQLLLEIATRYGLLPEHLLFFKIHTTEDEFHVQDGLDIAAAVCTTKAMQDEAIEAVHTTCQKFRAFFDGIDEACTSHASPPNTATLTAAHM